MKKCNYIYLIVILLITFGAFSYYQASQPIVDYEKCTLCDGNKYSSIFNYFEDNAEEYNVKYPFHSRILVPYLATLLSGSLTDNFQILNLLFSLISVVIIFLIWKKLNIPITLISIGMFWLIFHWTGMIRLNAFDPITVDVPLYLFHGLLLLILSLIHI